MRWTSSRIGEGYTCTLLGDDVESSEAFKKLLSSFASAKFGLEMEELYDEEYRKALKLDSTEFATRFCPYKAGIIDTVAQLLPPEAKGHEHK